MLDDLLTSAGFRVLMAENGAETLRCSRRKLQT